MEGVTETLLLKEPGNWTKYNTPVYSGPTHRAGQLSQVDSLSPLGTDVVGAVIPGNPNASGTHELIERPAPKDANDPNADTTIVDPPAYQAHRIYNVAGLRVFINHRTAYQTSDKAGPQNVHVYTRDTSNPPDSYENSVEIYPTTPPAAPTIANSIINAITLSQGTVNSKGAGTGDMFDFRQGNDVNVSTVDMSKLTPALNGSSTFNGVLYITDITNADGNGNESSYDTVRLQKGGTLPDAGLTVATDGALYVQGDYNTGTTYGSDTPLQPGSNAGGDPTKTYSVPGYTPKPSSVMGDAVMILSNNWQDDNSSKNLKDRIATPTTLNVAIVSGSVLTTPDAASGGAHNFPRFLEDWTKQNFTYRGSMCELYQSTRFTGTYGKTNVYQAPVRRWFYDDTFSTTAPPGNLKVTHYGRGRWIRSNNL